MFELASAAGLLWQLACGALLGLLLLVFIDGFHPAARWRLRHIPGPPPLWLLGNTLEIARHDYFLYRAWAVWGSRYGKVFKWFWGPQPVVCIRDAHVARQIMVRHFKAFPDRSMYYPPQDATVTAVLASGITFAKGTYWHGLRGSLQPLFHSAGLRSYQPLIEAAAGELCGELAATATAGGSVDMHAALGNVALKAIGEAAFGVGFQTQQVDAAGQIHEHQLVAAANYALENTGKSLVFMLTPPLLRAAAWRAVRAAPPASIRALNNARMQLYTAALTLARNAMRRLGRPWEDELGMAAAFDRPETRPVAARYASVVPAEGSVVDLLVRAKDRLTGLPLKAHQIVAQVNSIVVAGHDTTSFCLTSTLYWVSRHPRVKARLLEELDRAAGPEGRHLGATDLEQLPYLDAVLRESLRLSPPGWMTTREALEDIALPYSPVGSAASASGGDDAGSSGRVGSSGSSNASGSGGGSVLFLPRGSVVYIDFIGIQRDPDYWGPDADAFAPERFLDKSPAAQERDQLAWLAFGAGPRTCIGYKFALGEAKAVLAALWRRYDFEVDTERTPLPPALRPGITLGYRQGLHFRVTPRAGGGAAAAAAAAAGDA